MPIEQEKAKGPSVLGVNSIVVSPVSGSNLLIFKVGMVKDREQLETLVVISFSWVGIFFLRVMFEGEYPLLDTFIVVV